MIIICPNCETHFDVSEAALNPAGRTVRCAHCGHKWHQDPPEAGDFGAASDFDDIPLSPPSPPPLIEEEEEERPPPMNFFIDAAPEEETQAAFDPEDLPFPDRRNRDNEDGEETSNSLFPLPMNDEPSVFPDTEPEEASAVLWPEDSASSASDNAILDSDDLSLEDAPPPAPPAEDIPSVLKKKKTKAPPSSPPKKKRGFLGRFALFLLLPIFIVATILFALRDMVIEQAPFMEDFYDFTDSQTRAAYNALGLGGEVVGAGLVFRDIDSEWIMQDDSAVMIVRAVIVNTTNEPQEIPTLRLALIDSKRAIVQEKEIKPPQFLLSGKSRVPFVITLDNPDMSASSFEITFSATSVFDH